MNLHLKSKYRKHPTLIVCLLVMSFALSTIVPGGGVRAQTPGPEYIVQEGDTLYTIALAFGVSVEALQQANGITDPSLLAIGQTLIIPGYEGIEGVLKTYRVQLGETLAGLAKRFGTTTEALIRINRLTNAESLYVSQPLIYPEGSGGLPAGRTALLKKNDSLPALAARNGLNVWALAMINDIDSPFSASAGQHVIVPADPASGPTLTGLPQPFETLTFQPARPTQGATLEIVAQMNGGATVGGQFYKWPLLFAADGDPARQVALQGIHTFTDPALYLLTLTAIEPDGTTTTFEQLVPVADGNYPSQQLFLGADQSALLDPDIVGPERERVAQTISAYTAARQWNGLFVKPVPSERITTGFGWRRSYNGGPYDSYHDGIDYGAPGGTVIIAPADGTVVFAGSLQVRGNTTIIDHGWGVYSGYWHQYQIYVQAGQVVTQGEAIGEVGSSGLSTGSHLHFSMWVGGNAVNPEQWLTTAFP